MKSIESFTYHRSITLLSGMFGAVFNEIKIVRQDGAVILVPIAYEIKQKYNVRLDQNPDRSNTMKYKIILPRLSFKLVSWQKDPARQTSRYNQLIEQGVDRTQVTSLNSQRNRVPYKFIYQLNAKTKNIDDMLQIVEQVLVMFNPSLNVMLLDNPDLNADSAINIKLIDSQMQDIFDGSFEDEQVLETAFNFEVDGWLYMPTASAKVITKVIANLYDMGHPEAPLETIIEVP